MRKSRQSTPASQQSLVQMPSTGTLRLDKNHTRRALDFSCFGVDEDMCRDMTIFLTNKIQRSNGLDNTFTAAEFADRMEIARSELSRQHPNPIILQHPELLTQLREYNPLFTDSHSSRNVYTNVVENALATLNLKNMTFSNHVRIHTGLEHVEVESYNIVSKQGITLDPKHVQRRLYHFRFNDIAVSHSFIYYTNIVLAVYNALRQARLQQAYLMLEDEIQVKWAQAIQAAKEQNLSSFSIYFEIPIFMAMKIFRLNVQDLTAAKQKIKAKIEKLITVAGWDMTYTFIRTGNDQYPYTLKLSVHSLKHLDTPAVSKHLLIKEATLTTLAFWYQNRQRSITFDAWLNSQDQDLATKYSHYLKARTMIYKTKAEDNYIHRKDFCSLFEYGDPSKVFSDPLPALPYLRA